MTATPPATIQRLSLACPGCGEVGVYSFCEINDMPVDVGRVPATRVAAVRATRGDIQLCYCNVCGLVHNAKYDHAKIAFEPGYEVALHHSATFRTFIESLAQRLIKHYDLTGRRVLDIGCGGGYFLTTLAQLGGIHGTGIDPTVPTEGTVQVGDGSTHFIRDFWSGQHADLIGDFVTCQSMFEDISRPLKFLQELRAMIGDRPVPVYLEVFHGFRAFEQHETWSIHYEQCNYFHLECLEQLFATAGFEVTQSGTCYEADQYLYVEGRPTTIPHGQTRLSARQTELPESILKFANGHSASIASWNERLAAWRADRRQVAIWGSGGKCVNFLNTIDAKEDVHAVIDINPDRQGNYIPGSGHQIISPDQLPSRAVDVVIIMNPLYRDEIGRQIAELGVECEIVTG